MWASRALLCGVALLPAAFGSDWDACGPCYAAAGYAMDVASNCKRDKCNILCGSRQAFDQWLTTDAKLKACHQLQDSGCDQYIDCNDVKLGHGLMPTWAFVLLAICIPLFCAVLWAGVCCCCPFICACCATPRFVRPRKTRGMRLHRDEELEAFVETSAQQQVLQAASFTTVTPAAAQMASASQGTTRGMADWPNAAPASNAFVTQTGSSQAHAPHMLYLAQAVHSTPGTFTPVYQPVPVV